MQVWVFLHNNITFQSKYTLDWIMYYIYLTQINLNIKNKEFELWLVFWIFFK